MNFGRRFDWLNREKIVLVVGLIALLGGALLPWYRLPPQVLETFRSNLVAATIGRIITALFVGSVEMLPWLIVALSTSNESLFRKSILEIKFGPLLVMRAW